MKPGKQAKLEDASWRIGSANEFLIATDRVHYLAAAGDVFRQLRGDRKQVEIAQVASIAQASLSRYEQGATAPDVVELRRLAHAFGLTAPELIALIEQMYERVPPPAQEPSRKAARRNRKTAEVKLNLWRTRPGGVVVLERSRMIRNGVMKIEAYRHPSGAWHGWMRADRLRPAGSAKL